MHLQSIHLNLIAIAGSFSRRRHRRIQRGESVSWKQDWSHCTFPMCNDLRKNFIVGVTFGTQDDLLSAICRFFVACIGVLMWSVKLWRFLSWRLGYSCVLIHIFIYIYIRAGNLQIDVYIYDILMCCPDTQPGDIELRCVAWAAGQMFLRSTRNLSKLGRLRFGEVSIYSYL